MKNVIIYSDWKFDAVLCHFDVDFDSENFNKETHRGKEYLGTQYSFETDDATLEKILIYCDKLDLVYVGDGKNGMLEPLKISHKAEQIPVGWFYEMYDITDADLYGEIYSYRDDDYDNSEDWD